MEDKGHRTLEYIPQACEEQLGGLHCVLHSPSVEGDEQAG